VGRRRYGPPLDETDQRFFGQRHFETVTPEFGVDDVPARRDGDWGNFARGAVLL
jgi:hypothetical protein